LLIPVASAFGGATAIYFFLGFGYWAAWEQWFLGNALAQLVVTPAILYFIFGAAFNIRALSPQRCVEGGLLAVGLVMTCYMAFNTGADSIGFTDARFYAPVPFLFWAAVRFGMFGASGAIAVIAFFSVQAAQDGRAPFSGLSPDGTALALQNFLLLRAAPLYLVAVLIEQRKGIENSLRQRVKELTTLHGAARIFQNEQKTTPEWLQQFVAVLPSAWQYPEITAARIRLGELEFTTPNFRPTPWIQRADFSVAEGLQGAIEVVYLEERPAEQEGPFLAEERNLIDSLAEMLRAAFERKRANEMLRENETVLRASYDRIQDLAGRLITAQEAERSRIAGELHDDVNQQLAGLSIALSNVKRQLQNGKNGTVQEEITRLQQRTIDLADVIRNLSHELHPGVLQHAGLVAALRGHCAEVGRQHEIEVTLSADAGLDGIPNDVALCLYRVAQEALRNIAAHAAAHKAQVTLRSSKKGLEMVIADDGQGFDLAEAREVGGLGLISLDERVRLIGGSLAISTEPKHGTEVRVQVPLGGNQ
jgi:signal transduction histidine kinase